MLRFDKFQPSALQRTHDDQYDEEPDEECEAKGNNDDNIT